MNSLFVRRHFDGWWRKQRISIHRFFGQAEEIRKELIELFLSQRIKFMVMTGGASCSQTQPNGRCRFHSVDGIANIVLFIDRPTFTGRYVAPIEPGCHFLSKIRCRQKVSSQLLNGEFVEGHIPVEGLDHPVPIGPDLPFIVQVEPVGICITGRIQPDPRHMFTVAV